MFLSFLCICIPMVGLIFAPMLKGLRGVRYSTPRSSFRPNIIPNWVFLSFTHPVVTPGPV